MARQKHKSKKRPKTWHRGRAEARLWSASELPDVGSGADPTQGRPDPLRRQGKQNRGDAA